MKTLLATLLLAFSTLALADRTDIHAAAEDVQPLLPGMTAPAFELRTADDQPFPFDPAGMERPVVVTFFRGGWCPYCNLHLSEMRHAEARLKELGFDVWFVSMDRPGVLVESLDEPDIGYTLLSDSRLGATRGFGIAFRVEDATVERYKGFGVDLEEASGEDHHVLPAPATFIIGQDGVINFAYVNPSYDVRLAPSVLLAAAEAYREGADRRLKRNRG
ncbi:MAG: peroxiredoxin-like family protein [Xanthomonadales bacterium]|jgi:peroxiredoxin|nr:peroxiredoxin-like family protein [Xanthomonadales bacterium]